VKSFLEHMIDAPPSQATIVARRTYMAERGWTAEDWYIAWQTTDLPNEVVKAVTDYVAK
jgi:hypothetical protein